MSLVPTGFVNALITLPGGGIAAGTENFDTGAGSVDVWPNTSSMQNGGSPPISLVASESRFRAGLVSGRSHDGGFEWV